MNTWDDYYRSGRSHSEIMLQYLRELFIFVLGNDWTGQRIFELGCGEGANAKEIIARGGIYHGIDISPFAIAVARKVIPQGKFACADFTAQDHPAGGEFDIVFDRAALCHVDRSSLQRAVGLAFDNLKHGGIFIGCDWFSMTHSEFQRGKVVDEFTRCDYPDGQFREAGNVHFTSEHELVEIFKDWEPMAAQERAVFRPGPGLFMPSVVDCPWISNAFAGKEYVSAWWDVVARKPK